MPLFPWIPKWAQRPSDHVWFLFYGRFCVENSEKDGGSQNGGKMGKIGPRITPKINKWDKTWFYYIF